MPLTMRLGGNGFGSQSKLRHSQRPTKSFTYYFYVICDKLMVTHYHALLGLPDMGHAINCLFSVLVRQKCVEPAKQCSP